MEKEKSNWNFFFIIFYISHKNYINTFLKLFTIKYFKKELINWTLRKMNRYIERDMTLGPTAQELACNEGIDI